MAVNQMTEGKIPRQLIYFAIPVLISNLFQQLYNTIDVAIVGKFVGPKALAAVGTCNLIVVFMIYFFMGLSNGSSIIISQYFGENDSEKLSDTVHTTMGLSFISGAILTIVGILSCEQILRWINTPDDVIGYATTYIKVYFLSMIPMMIFNMGSGILRAMGDSKTPLYFLGISGVSNIILDLLFVVKFNYGVMGAALATTLAQLISAILILARLTFTNQVYKLHFNKIRINLGILKKILVIGIPTGIQSVLVCFANIIVQSKVNLFGLNAMASLTIYYKIEGFIYMPIEAIAMAISNFTGQNVGANNWDRVREGKKLSLQIGFFITVLMGALILIFNEPIIRVFSDDKEVIKFTAQFLLWVVPLYFVYEINQVLMGILRGVGKTFVPMIISLVCMCGFRIAWLCIMLYFVKDIRIIYLSYPLTWILTNIGMRIYYKKAIKED